MDFNGDFYNFTVVAIFANCCVKPIIYAAKYKEFQQGLAKFARKFVNRGNTEPTATVSSTLD